jgi:hypothetical protein
MNWCLTEVGLVYFDLPKCRNYYLVCNNPSVYYCANLCLLFLFNKNVNIFIISFHEMFLASKFFQIPVIGT